jgi:hypothetical protein
MDKRSNADNRHLCCFSYSDGRQCRMLRHRDHPGLCPFHSREERQALESERIGTELAATLTGHFLTASDINHVLGKVFTALAQDRISIKKAKALAYVAQLMLQSIPTVKDETKFKYTYETWSKMIDNAKKLPKPLPATSHGFADAVFATADARAATRDRHSPDGQHSASANHNPAADSNATTNAANVGAPGPDARGKNTSPSPASASEAAAAGAQPLGVGASAPTYKTAQSAHLSSAHPSANSADACADSSPLKRATTTNRTNEDTTEEPALVGAGSTTRRSS